MKQPSFKPGNAFNSTLKAGKGFKKKSTGFKKKAGLERPSRIKHTSDRRAKEYAIYLPKKAEYLKNHPVCEACKRNASVDLHHKLTREGKMLYNEKYFLALCRECHTFVHDNPKEAQEKGWIIKRI